jgi:glycosyltransferase involved in cell wall biosynthesis
MRLIHIYSGNLYGGVERVLVAFARAARPDLPQTFALAYDGRLRRELDSAAADVITIGAARARAPWTIWRARRRLAVLLSARETPIAVVAHSPWALAVVGPAAQEAGAFTTLYLHSAPTSAPWPDGWARRTPVDLVIANSAYTARISRPFLPSVPIACLYPPVDLTPPSAADRLQVRRELGTAEDDVVILQASRMEALKGHAALVEALAALRNVPGWTAWIAGGAQRTAERVHILALRRAVTAAGLEQRVRFTGERADVPRLAAAADIYCQPNRDPEGFGIAFVEAMAAGLPVVTTAAGGALEIVNAECGRLVPPADAPALAATLEQLITNAPLRHALGTRGPARARTLCDAPTQTARLAEMLTSVTARVSAR